MYFQSKSRQAATRAINQRQTQGPKPAMLTHNYDNIVFLPLRAKTNLIVFSIDGFPNRTWIVGQSTMLGLWLQVKDIT